MVNARRDEADKRLRAIGEAGRQEVYDMIYHATSRTVHFTSMELLRLVERRVSRAQQ